MTEEKFDLVEKKKSENPLHFQTEIIKDLIESTRHDLGKFLDTIDLQEINSILQLLAKSKGLIFLTGVGKSGMVAHKIAVTMTSTGTRALFLSPTDSMHGDIGLISDEDIVILISKSGESDELLNMLPFLRNKGAKMIAVVMNKESRLAKACHLAITLPFEKELCPYDMAPTTSTTEQLIFGDILAIALMKVKNFSSDQFAANHPAGRLGKRITMKVSDLMIKDPMIPFCSKDDLLLEILVELSNKRAGCIFIVDQNRILEGIFTDGDLRRALQTHGANVLQIQMKDLMIKNPKFTSPEILAIEAMRFMEGDQKFPIMALPVIEKGNKVVGLLKLHDIIQSGV